MQARSPRQRGSERQRGRELRGRVETVEREARAESRQPRDRTESSDAGAGRGMDPPRWLARRAQHLREELQLSLVAADVRLIRGREMREETIDLDMTQLADRRETSGRVRDRRTEARKAGIDLEVHAHRPTC